MLSWQQQLARWEFTCAPVVSWIFPNKFSLNLHFFFVFFYLYALSQTRICWNSQKTSRKIDFFKISKFSIFPDVLVAIFGTAFFHSNHAGTPLIFRFFCCLTPNKILQPNVVVTTTTNEHNNKKQQQQLGIKPTTTNNNNNWSTNRQTTINITTKNN